ncbi:MAG TPA: dTDP-4-dehydrorhamnose reductase [Allosphingosinicella sp.]|nr:dTDP-4-dehydrorhamnose reductase [Allosphingosinicella sp.]
MKILVTGRHGQLARSLVERCASHPGLEIVALGRPVLDLEAPETIAPALDAVDADVIVNAAAYTAVDRAEDEPDRAWAVNAEAPGLLAAAAAARDIPIVHLSTDYVFDGSGDGARDETARTGPLGVYGRSKLAGEEKVRAATPRHAIVRTAWVYSPFGTNFVKTMIDVARTRDALAVVSDQHGNPTSALDLADGLLDLLERWNEGAGDGGTYHLAGTGDASWFELACEVFAQCRKHGLPAADVRPIATADWPTRAVRPANSRLDSGRFERDFGFRMPDWRASVAATVERLAGGGRDGVP